MERKDLVIKTNHYLVGGVTTSLEAKIKRVKDACAFILSNPDDLTEDRSKLTQGVSEGFYDEEKMVWEDSCGGTHSQRCNAFKLVNGERNPLPDGASGY